MNILLINHYAGSPQLGMEFRPYYMAREWQKAGHKVLIVGATFSHLRKRQPQPSDEVIDGIHYRWVKTNEYKGNGIGRIRSMFSFVWQLKHRYKKILNGFVPDVVIASSTYPLDNYPAKKIADHYGAKYIYEIHDLWPLSPMELGGYSPKHPFIRVMQRAEDFAYANVDAVVSMLPKAIDHTEERGLPREKFFYVPNGIVEEDWEKPEQLPAEHIDLITRLKSENKFLVGFAGAHGIANSLQSIIDAVNMLEKQNVSLVLVGTGQEKENLINYVTKNNIRNVFFLPPVSKFAVPSFLKEMDVLYIGLQNQSLFRFGISPNKMFDYMMASKPIIQAIKAGNNLVREAECGIDVEPENVDAIANAIQELQNMSSAELEQLGINGHEFVIKNHTYSVLANKFVDVFEKLLN
ncbi:MAG: glycosyltransferase family 4 protein [Bacteroidales bacterium]|nr:glycosyltransferase family 4 protein [Bacteroidales bacterium]